MSKDEKVANHIENRKDGKAARDKLEALKLAKSTDPSVAQLLVGTVADSFVKHWGKGASRTSPQVTGLDGLEQFNDGCAYAAVAIARKQYEVEPLGVVLMLARYSSGWNLSFPDIKSPVTLELPLEPTESDWLPHLQGVVFPLLRTLTGY